MDTIVKNKIYTIDNFITNLECDNFIKQIDDKENIVNFTNTGQFKNDKYIDLELATYFYNKLISNNINLQLLRPNKLIMTGKYKEGNQFAIHTDTGLFYDKNKKEKSMYTLLIYLNDNFDQGETIFYNNNLIETIKIIPKKGMALLFHIDEFHKGNMVKNGTKYWIGCEIISNFI